MTSRSPSHTIPDLVHAIARSHPDRIAVSAADGQWTFAELTARATQLATVLRDRGVRPGDLVGVCMPRTRDSIAALLAAWVAGAAYLPLDASYPPHRLEYLARDSGFSALLTTTQLRERVPVGTGTAVIDTTAIPVSPSPEPWSPHLGPADLAYVIYTSGSTGEPKGVMVEHASLSNLVRWHGNAFAVTGDDRCSHIAADGFDASVWEIWAALGNGAAIHIIPEDIRQSFDEAIEWCATEAITVAFLPTVMAEHLLGRPVDDRLRLRILLTGGDRLRLHPGEQPFTLVNNYGPTECTVVATSTEVPAGESGTAAPSIGSAIDDTRIILMNEAGQADDTGEMWICGAGVARGYLHRPELTAERFVIAPDGARAYRTGDLARRNPDGSFEFLGRADDQVKIRGYRVELGEIDATLRSLDGIADCVTLARPDAASQQRLISYVVPADGTAPPPEPSSIREALAGRLPPYMVPSAFVMLDGLPLSANGKVDRDALGEPPSEPLPAADAAQPDDPTEILTAMFTEVLGGQAAEADTDFFDAGGHSIQLTMLLARIRDSFGVELKYRDLFAAATPEDLAELLASHQPVAEAPMAPLAEQEVSLPLSPTQQQLWLTSQLASGAAVNNAFRIFRVDGTIDVAALEWAIGEVVRRHEILRTRFVIVDDAPVQWIEPHCSPRVELIDVGDAAEVADAVASVVTRPFDVSALPLLRPVIVRGSDETQFVIVLHHLITDGWSLELFLTEVADRYRDRLSGTTGFEPPAAEQYGDFARSQRDRWESPALKQLRSEYVDALSDYPQLLELPADRPRPLERDFLTDTVHFTIPSSVADAVEQLGRKHGATRFMTLLAACDVLLHRWSGQDRFLVGSPVSNRTTVAAESMMGFFVNTLVLPADLSADPSFATFLDRVTEASLAAFTRQEVPFAALVEDLDPQRSLAYNPLVQVMFSLQDIPSAQPELPGASLIELPETVGATPFDLAIHLTPTADGLRGDVRFATELFDSATAERLAAAFKHLLAAIADDAHRPVSQLPLLAAEEQAELAALGTGPVRQVDPTVIPWKIRRTAQHHPDRVAVEDDDGTWTYAELMAQVKAMSATLHDRGVRPGSLVGVCLGRDRMLLAALLAVWMSGGAFVPLDPAYPRKRLEYMIADSGLGVLLTSPPIAADLEVGEAVDIVVPHEAAEYDNPQWPDVSVTGADLAYVMYTSGSTGNPKGVMVEHSNLVNLLDAYAANPGFGIDDRFLSMSSLSFDPAVREMTLPLTVGGRVIIAGEVTADPAELHALLSRGATHFGVTPGVMKLYTAYTENVPATVRQLYCGGETISDALAESLADMDMSVYHGYGPTETTVSVCFAPVTAGAPITIGRPIANTRLDVVDSHGRLVPRGVPGELVISGAGVGRGYLHRPELTAERFRPGPNGSRGYYTGDLVRWTSDGNLKFLGRTDDQVKINGCRVELGEIDGTIRNLPGVRDNLTVARQDPSGGKRLVGYVLSEPGSRLETASLHTAAAESLPSYMLPSAWAILDAFPLTPNGKVDINALPEPAPSHRDQAPPATDTERTLAEIWRDVLGVSEVSRDAEFFTSGGHSLAAMRVVTRVRERLHPDLALRDVFAHPRLRELAAHVDGLRRSESATATGAIERVDRSKHRIDLARLN